MLIGFTIFRGQGNEMANEFKVKNGIAFTDGTIQTTAYTGGASGTVTSVGISLPSIFTTSGSPVTTSGTLTASLNSQTANTFFAAPSGSAGTPTFRTLTAADIPDLTLEKLPDAWAKKAVRVATTANITLSGTQTIDGIAVVAGDRVLVKDQTTASQNGIYVVAAGAWSRSADANIISELAGACVSVDSGTTNGGYRFDTNLKTTDTLGTTSVTFYRILDLGDTATANTASKIVLRDASGNFSAGTITAALSGNASTATALQTARTINGVSFNGTANITVADSTKLPLSGGTLTGLLNVTTTTNTTAGNIGFTTHIRDTTSDTGVNGMAGLGFSSAPGMDFAIGKQWVSGVSSFVIKDGAAALGTNLLTLSTSGNLGLGVTPSAWSSSYKVLQVGATTSLADSSNYTTLQNNYWINGGGSPIYLTTAPASFYQQYNGIHSWYSAASGTAGTAISFPSASMTLSAAGALNTTGAITQNGSQVLHAGNFNNYAVAGTVTIAVVATLPASPNANTIYFVTG